MKKVNYHCNYTEYQCNNIMNHTLIWLPIIKLSKKTQFNFQQRILYGK